jgi:iron complex outermembrane receptor protein
MSGICKYLQQVLVVMPLFLLFPITGYAQSHPSFQTTALDQKDTDITELSLEELMDLEVTSVSKRKQKLSEAAAAVFVITKEDIRRSGATSIPEALRMVPGLQVAHIDANKWAITSRGFNGRFANKLLVLMDGRSVYTPLYSGVFWDRQDTILEDLERIEVIRGPGATLWGANAVNGVINIITQEAKDTQGGLVTAGFGTEERGFGSVRQGGKLGDNTYGRVWAKYLNRNSAVYASGNDAADDWDVIRGGFRIDWQASERNSLTLEGDIYEGDAGQGTNYATIAPPYSVTSDEDLEYEGRNALLRWKRSFSKSSDMTLQMYYDKFLHEEPLAGLNMDTYDIDFQHRVALGNRQEIIWGLGYRHIRDHIRGSFNALFNPNDRSTDLFSAFIQDDIILVKNRLRLSIGSKLEDNDYTGFEIQPSGRIIWTPEGNQSVWAAVSRAVRTPSRAEHDVQANLVVIPPGVFPNLLSPLPLVYSNRGNQGFDSEELLAYELGYRVHPMEQLSFDIAAFFNDYSNLRSSQYAASLDMSDPQYLAQPIVLDNMMDGETYGIEMAADWRPRDWWRLQTGYTFLQMKLHKDAENNDPAGESAEGESPHNQISLRSSMDLSKELEFDLWARYVDKLPAQNIEGYVTLDTRLGWKPKEDLELSLVGQNLLDNEHPEFEPEFVDVLPTEVERSVYGKITCQF